MRIPFFKFEFHNMLYSLRETQILPFRGALRAEESLFSCI